MNLIFAVGGTGQELLYYINQAYLCNAIEDSFKAYVIDTDSILPGLDYFDKLYRQSAKILSDFSVPGTRIGQPPSLELWRIGGVGGGTVHEMLTGQRASDLPYASTADAFFERDDLAQDTREGCYARPALASVIVANSILQRINDTVVAGAERVVVMGSIIGGTGGGLIVPILAKLQTVCSPNTRIYCLAMGEYFRPDDDKLDAAIRRFSSNSRMNRTLMANAVSSIWRNAIIEEPVMPRKIKLPEQEPPFPLEENPFWRALSTYRFMVRDTVTDRAGNFAANEVNWNEVRPGTSYAQSTQSIDNMLATVRVLETESPFERVSREPFPRQCWGNFYAFSTAIASLQQKSLGREGPPRRFLDRVSHHLRSGVLVSTDHPTLSMRTRFPSRPIAKVDPSRFRSFRWPDLVANPTADGFANYEQAALATAAATVFCAARLGGAAGDFG
jgi:hypothetical protein